MARTGAHTRTHNLLLTLYVVYSQRCETQGAGTPRSCTTNAASDFVYPADIGRIDGTYRIFPLPHALE
jgi:hypothetical protein